MIAPSISDIENSLLPYRQGRRLILSKLINCIIPSGMIKQPFLFISRMFCRIKSADSILEKIKRKGITLESTDDLPVKLPDILGFRLIVEDERELSAIDEIVKSNFEVVSKLDKRKSFDEFGAGDIEYGLRYLHCGVSYPFELQVRTFLQHYWASRSFHLFHKKPRESALGHKNTLCELSRSLANSEVFASNLDYPAFKEESLAGELQIPPIQDRVHIVVVEPGEIFISHRIFDLTGIDALDHKMLTQEKLLLYETNPCCAIVECCCMSFSTYMLNEPQVQVPLRRIVCVHF